VPNFGYVDVITTLVKVQISSKGGEYQVRRRVPGLGCLVNINIVKYGSGRTWFFLKNLDIKSFNIVAGGKPASVQAHWFRSEGKIHLSKR